MKTPQMGGRKLETTSLRERYGQDAFLWHLYWPCQEPVNFLFPILATHVCPGFLWLPNWRKVEAIILNHQRRL